MDPTQPEVVAPDRVVLTTARPQPVVNGNAMQWLGGALLVIAGVLVWREVSLEAVVMLLVGSGAAMVGTLVLERKKKSLLGPALTLASVVVSSAWYAATRDPLVLLSLASGFATFAWLAFANRARTALVMTPAHRMFAWQGLAWSGLALTLATSFHLFHGSELLGDGFVARRVIVTVAWLAAGLAGVVWGGKREDRAVLNAGLVLTVAALGKLLLYDTTHLDGVLRIAAFALAGGLTWVGGRLITPKAPVVA